MKKKVHMASLLDYAYINYLRKYTEYISSYKGQMDVFKNVRLL